MALPLLIGAAAVGIIAKTVLRALGLGIITIVGTAGLVAAVSTIVQGQLSGLPSDIQNGLGLLRMDLVVNMLLAGVVLRLTIAGAKKIGVL